MFSLFLNVLFLTAFNHQLRAASIFSFPGKRRCYFLAAGYRPLNKCTARQRKLKTCPFPGSADDRDSTLVFLYELFTQNQS